MTDKTVADRHRRYAAENAGIAASLQAIGNITAASRYQAAADAHRRCAAALDKRRAHAPARSIVRCWLLARRFFRRFIIFSRCGKRPIRSLPLPIRIPIPLRLRLCVPKRTDFILSVNSLITETTDRT